MPVAGDDLVARAVAGHDRDVPPGQARASRRAGRPPPRLARPSSGGGGTLIFHAAPCRPTTPAARAPGTTRNSSLRRGGHRSSLGGVLPLIRPSRNRAILPRDPLEDRLRTRFRELAPAAPETASAGGLRRSANPARTRRCPRAASRACPPGPAAAGAAPPRRAPRPARLRPAPGPSSTLPSAARSMPSIRRDSTISCSRSACALRRTARASLWASRTIASASCGRAP